jgi:hypothetical protein
LAVCLICAFSSGVFAASRRGVHWSIKPLTFIAATTKDCSLASLIWFSCAMAEDSATAASPAARNSARKNGSPKRRMMISSFFP